MSSPSTLRTDRRHADAGTAPPLGLVRHRAHLVVAVLADTPLYALGTSEILRRRGAFEIAVATTKLREVQAVVASGAVRVVVLVTSRPHSEHAERWPADIAEAAAPGSPVATVLVVSTARPPRPPGAAAVRTPAPRATTVITTHAGADGLIRAVFEARRARRPAAPGLHLRRATVPTGPTTTGGALTPRELDVLQGMADGLSSKHIAERLGVSVHTVRTHVQRLLPKLGVHTRLRATAVAVQEGLVERSSAVF